MWEQSGWGAVQDVTVPIYSTKISRKYLNTIIGQDVVIAVTDNIYNVLCIIDSTN